MRNISATCLEMKKKKNISKKIFQKCFTIDIEYVYTKHEKSVKYCFRVKKYINKF